MLKINEVRKITLDAYGDAGAHLVDLWGRYNDLYFAGELPPILITRARTFAYGRCIGLTTIGTGIRHIQVKQFSQEVCDEQRAVLLHEMLHQYLRHRGLPSKHEGEAWCAEVRRISALLGKPVWAGRYTVIRVDGRSTRANKPPPDDFTGGVVMQQRDIASWPQSIELSPPDL